MTINSLQKVLSKLIKKGFGRKEILVDKTTFNHPREYDGITLLPILEIKLKQVELEDEDGGWKEWKDGTLATRTYLLLRGSKLNKQED